MRTIKPNLLFWPCHTAQTNSTVRRHSRKGTFCLASKGAPHQTGQEPEYCDSSSATPLPHQSLLSGLGVWHSQWAKNCCGNYSNSTESRNAETSSNVLLLSCARVTRWTEALESLLPKIKQEQNHRGQQRATDLELKTPFRADAGFGVFEPVHLSVDLQAYTHIKNPKTTQPCLCAM